MALPRFIVLKSHYNQKYLRYINEDVQVHGFMQFTGDEVVSQYSKLAVENAEVGNGLVHLRCCYNNKYLRRWAKHNWWIVAAADQPDENQSQWTCTLFKPVPVDGDDKAFRFMHVQLGRYACLWMAAAPYTRCLFAQALEPRNDKTDVHTVIDWESLVILPNRVAFKGDNGKYLQAQWIEDHQYLQFSSTDPADDRVGQEIFYTPDGNIRVKSDYYGKFWRRSPNWIWGDSTDTSNDNLDTLFWPVKVDNNVVALRNLGNNLFCKRLTADRKSNCLNADVHSITKEARLDVEELVISRQIYNVQFRLMDARIYNERIVTMATDKVVNNTTTEHTDQVNLSHTQTTSNTWNSSLSLKIGVTTNINTGIPIIAEGSIEVSTDFEGSYSWGQTNETTTKVENVYTVPVPPNTVVKVRLIATIGSCDVPFSYTQRDVLTNGQQVIREMDDGLYSGVNPFNFHKEITEEKL